MKRPVLVVVIVVVVIAFGAIFARRVNESNDRNTAAAAQAAKGTVPSVAVALVEKRDLPQVIEITGVVRAKNEVSVLPKVPGRVTRVFVDVGAFVKAGDTLATTESNDQALRLKQAEAQLKVAQQGLEQAKVQTSTATASFERAKNLFAKGALSQMDFESAEHGWKMSGVAVQAAEAQVALADASVAIAGSALADTRIASPVAGVVTKRSVDVGAMASGATAAFHVQDQTSLKMEGTVPASYVGRLKKGLKVTISVDELPGQTFTGEVAQIAPTLEAETRRGSIEVSLPPAAGLLPYMFGHAEIAFGNTSGVLVVPSTAVLSVAGAPALYAVRENHAVLLKLKLGAKHESSVIVEEGVGEGESVVISGDTGLHDGVPVAVAGAKG